MWKATLLDPVFWLILTWGGLASLFFVWVRRNIIILRRSSYRRLFRQRAGLVVLMDVATRLGAESRLIADLSQSIQDSDEDIEP